MSTSTSLNNSLFHLTLTFIIIYTINTPRIISYSNLYLNHNFYIKNIQYINDIRRANQVYSLILCVLYKQIGSGYKNAFRIDINLMICSHIYHRYSQLDKSCIYLVFCLVLQTTALGLRHNLANLLSSEYVLPCHQ